VVNTPSQISFSLHKRHPVFLHDALTSTRKELEKERNPSIERITQSHDRRDKKRQHSTILATSGNEVSCKTPRDMSLCTLCKGQHSLIACKNFLGRSVKERQELCMSKGICFSWLSQGHMARHCKQKTQCELCKKPHATVLHRFPPEVKREENMQETVRTTNSCINCGETMTSMILPVWIHHKSHPDR